VLVNKYVDGVPQLWEVVELSMSGALVRSRGGPESPRASYALEMASDADRGARNRRLWLCATPVWRHGRYEALSFVGQSAMDRLKLADLIDEARGAA
jgi:hypothetical protein